MRHLNIPVVSTQHLPRGCSLGDEINVGRVEGGMFVYLTAEELHYQEACGTDANTVESLVAILKWLNREYPGCEWLFFDEDGEKIPGVKLWTDVS